MYGQFGPTIFWHGCRCPSDISTQVIFRTDKFVANVSPALRRDFDRRNAFAVRFSSVHFGSMRGQNHYVDVDVET